MSPPARNAAVTAAVALALLAAPTSADGLRAQEADSRTRPEARTVTYDARSPCAAESGCTSDRPRGSELIPTGRGVMARIRQAGDRNAAAVAQGGTGLRAEVSQLGNDNTVDVSMYGASARFDATQRGNGHRISGTLRGFNSLLSVTQRGGNGNRYTFRYGTRDRPRVGMDMRVLQVGTDLGLRILAAPGTSLPSRVVQTGNGTTTTIKVKNSLMLPRATEAPQEGPRQDESP